MRAVAVGVAAVGVAAGVAASEPAPAMSIAKREPVSAGAAPGGPATHHGEAQSSPISSSPVVLTLRVASTTLVARLATTPRARTIVGTAGGTATAA